MIQKSWKDKDELIGIKLVIFKLETFNPFSQILQSYKEVIKMKKLLALCAVLLGSSFAYCYAYFKNTFTRLDHSTLKGDSPFGDCQQSFDEAIEAFSHVEHEVVNTYHEGLKLNAHFYDRKSDKVVIIMHGYRVNNQIDPAIVAPIYDDCDMLIPDQRSHGKSEGEYVTFGYKEKDDVLVWCEWLMKRNPDYKIILHGISMGAATVLMAASSNQQYPIRCVISDCAFANLYDQQKYTLELEHRFSTLLLAGAELLGEKLAGFKISQVNPEDYVKHNQVPALFIHGDIDTMVPCDNVYRLYNANASEKELLVIPGALHAMSRLVNPLAYDIKVKGFIEEYL